MNARLVAPVAVLAVAFTGAITGCGVSVSAGDVGEVVVREASEAEYADRYGSLGSAVLQVTADGRTYEVTMGARARTVLGIDSDGGYHEPRKRDCVTNRPLPYSVCRVYELPPGTTLVGFVLRDVDLRVN